MSAATIAGRQPWLLVTCYPPNKIGFVEECGSKAPQKKDAEVIVFYNAPALPSRFGASAVSHPGQKAAIMQWLVYE